MMIKQRAVVDTCAEQKTDMEEEYPRNEGTQNSQFVLNAEFQRQPVKFIEDGNDLI